MENEKSIEELTEQLKNLNAALDATLEAAKPVGPSLTITELDASQYLTDKAKAVLSNRVGFLSSRNDDGTFYLPVYFARRVRADNTEPSVKAITEAVNELAEEGLAYSTLAPISKCDLAIMVGEVPSVAVFCFVHVRSDKLQEIKDKYKNICTERDGIPESTDDLRIGLKEGEFFAHIRVSAIQFDTVFKNKKTADEKCDEEIKQLLAVLPRGTLVLEKTQCAICDLSIPYQVKFYNPLMAAVKWVELEHIRQAARVGDTLEQFPLLVGIKYMDADRKVLFRD